MTSTISLSKVNAVLKKNFRLNSVSLIVTNVIVIIGTVAVGTDVIGVPYTNLGMASVLSDVTGVYMGSVSGLLNVVGFVNLFILSLKMFKEIYSRQASDFFYSMPVTRKEYYTGNVLFGIINILFMFISAVAVSLIFMKLPIVADVRWNGIDLKELFQYMARIAVGLLLNFAIFIVSVVLCGKRWQAISASILSIISFAAAVSGIVMHMNTIYGYNVENNGKVIDNFLAVLNNGIQVSTVSAVIFRLAAAIAIFAVGYFVFKNRKAEVAEQSLSGKIVPALLLVAIDIGVFMTVFSMFNRSVLYLRIIIAVIFCVAVTVIFCAVFNKKAFTKNTGIACVAACVVSIAFAVGVETLPKVSGYIDYVPSAEEIQSIELAENSDDYAYMNDSFNTSYIEYIFENGAVDKEPDTINIESQEGIDCILKIHQKTIGDEAIEKCESYKKNDEDSYYDDWFSYKLTYNFKNGKKVTRCYSVLSSYVKEDCADFVRIDEVIDRSFPFNVNKDSILFARVGEPAGDSVTMKSTWVIGYGYASSYDEDSYFTLENYDEFFAGLKQDVKARNDANALMRTTSCFRLHDDYIENDYYIYIYYFDEDTPAEIIEKVKNMTLSQVEAYKDNSHNGHYLNTDLFFLNKTEDKNTINYLTDRGIIK